MGKRLRRGSLIAGLMLLGGGVVAWLLRPAPISVDLGVAVRGSLQVSVDEEGETRAHDRYVVAAPVTGRVLRIDLDDGDPVETGEVVARIAPVPLSLRECAEQQARVAAAEALERQAQEMLRHADADHAQAVRENLRLQELLRRGLVSTQAAELGKNAEVTSRDELQAARHRATAAAADVEMAKAGLMAMESCNGTPGTLLEVRAPVKGRIIRIEQKSERVVQAGTPLLVIGDPERLEVVVDVLSSEAVKIDAGMPALIENWGGDQPLQARVRLVEPYGYTKVSALGVEEQRVDLILDLVDPPGRLGDGFRVDARIIIWESPNVLKVPASAVFRHGDGLAVFVVEGDRAHRRTVTAGQRGAFEVQILAGLTDGERLVLYPPPGLDDGARIAALNR